MKEDKVKPAVIIATSDDFPREWLDEIRFGLEEEGVPYTVRTANPVEPFKEALLLTKGNALGVVVFCTAGEIRLHYAKLPEDSPLFIIKDACSKEARRRIGTNAARLVKRIPFALEEE